MGSNYSSHFGKGFLSHAQSEWKVYLALVYHMYNIRMNLKGTGLKDAVVISYYTLNGHMVRLTEFNAVKVGMESI